MERRHMLHLWSALAYTSVKLCLRRYQRSDCKCCTDSHIYSAPRTFLKHAGTNGASANAAFDSRFDVHLHENTVLAQRCAAPVSGFGHIYIGVGETLYYIGGSNSGTSANAALVIGFGVHLRETLSSRRCKRSVCKCCTCCPCQRIWRTPT